MADFFPGWALIVIGAALLGVLLGLALSDRFRKRPPDGKK